MVGMQHLYIPGPTNVPERIRSAINRPMEDMRAPDFPDFTKPLLEDLKKIFKTESGQVFVFPGSGTGGWEAALSNTLSPGDKVLASRFGQFSKLWVFMCEKLGLEVEVVDVEWGEGVPLETYADILARDTNHEIKAVLACQNETATGVASDIAGVRQALDTADHPALLFVDGVSSIASMDFQMDAWGVDAAVTGAQKGFMMPTGLAILAVSQKALAAAKTAKLPRCYFDFDWMSMSHQQGYFPYTPATTLLHGLRASVDMLLEEGLDSVFARHARLAEATRAAVFAWGLETVAVAPKWYSPTVTAIRVPEGVDAKAMIHHAYHGYKLSLGGGLDRLAGKAFRIGHLGDVNELMILSAIAGSEMALRDVGADIAPGAGVGAAQEALRLGDPRVERAAQAA